MKPDRVQLLVTFGYDGARFHGLQPQPDRPTAGAALRERFCAVGALPKALCFAARTDAGVHAEQNVATCWLRGVSDLEPLLARLAAPRGDGLTNVQLRQVPIHVHARASARSKLYRYVIEDGSSPEPEQGAASWRVAPRLDCAAMALAAQHLLGEHDFTSFRARRCNAGSPVKRLLSATVTSQSSERGTRIVIEVRGEAFLRQMVRIIVGTLAEIGAGLRAPEEMARILAARSRGAAGLTAPAHGLTLVEVEMALSNDGRAPPAGRCR